MQEMRGFIEQLIDEELAVTLGRETFDLVSQFFRHREKSVLIRVSGVQTWYEYIIVLAVFICANR